VQAGARFGVERFGHQPAQRGLVAHVPVQRRCLHRQPRRQRPHRNPIQPRLVEQGKGGGNDAGAIECNVAVAGHRSRLTI
jgi:hypothetical protein